VAGRPVRADISTFMKTYSPKPEHVERRWYVVDASGVVLGRLASEVATILRGKHKPMYAPHMDTGDHVVVVNADKIELTGNKGEDKYAYRHSGFPGGIRAVKYKDLMANRPVAAVEKAVRGMLPKNTIGRQMLKKLHVVPGPEHPHAAQSPQALALGERPAWNGLPSKPAAESKPKAASKPKPKATSPKPKSGTKSKATAAKPKAAKPKAKGATKASTAKPKAKSSTKAIGKRSAAKNKKTNTEE
jgi:large subunit ribosomal protein L13